MNIFILNDTRTDRHHGCEIVMRNLIRGLTERGGKIVGTLGWNCTLEKNRKLAKAAQSADTIIINGEGTIHHDQPYARYLLKTGNELARQGKAVYLINSTWQENSAELVDLARPFKGIWVRDRASAYELAEQGITANIAPDLTFLSSYALNDQARLGVIVSDSIFSELSKKLATLAEKKEWRYIPIIRKPNPRETRKQRERWIKSYIYSLLEKITLNNFKPRQYYFDIKHCINNTELYLQEFRQCEALVSARYHACCLAIQNRAPFIALSSNTRKIENLLSDIGIQSQKRFFSLKQLVEQAPEEIIKNSSFSTHETEIIENFLIQARIKINSMLDLISGSTKNNNYLPSKTHA